MTTPGAAATVDQSPPVTGTSYLRLILLGGLIGIPAALVAVLFLGLVEITEHLLWTELPTALGASEPPWYLVVGLPVVGALLVIAARRLLPGDGGHSPMEPISVAPTPLSYAPGIALAGFGTLAFGAVVGPEAPVIALGSAVGLAITGFVRLAPTERAVISSAGSFSAISALFGGPIVAGVMLTEAGTGLGAKLVPALLPGFVAAAIGYLIFVGVGDWTGLTAPGLIVPGLEPYEGTFIVDLVIAVVVGVATAVVIVLVRRTAFRVAEVGLDRLGMVPLLLASGLAVGVLALAAGGLGVDPQDVLFSGQASIPALLATESTGALVILLSAKALAYAVSLGGGFRGGAIFPAAFIGIGLAVFAVQWFDMSPTVAVAVGAAAGMAAQARLMLTSMLFGALLVGTAGVDAVPATVLAAAAAWVTATALERGRGTRSTEPVAAS